MSKTFNNNNDIKDVFFKTQKWLLNYQEPITSSFKGDGPTFSVIMPTFNRRHCIANAIDSLLNQTYKKFELIIVDDGSTDGTEEFIKKQYKEEIRKNVIKYHRLNKVGVSAARNEGLRRANNDWIAYLDSDNYLCTDYLETFANAILNNPNELAFNAKLVRVMDRVIVGAQYDEDSIFEKNTVDMGCYVNKRIIFSELGGFDEKMSRFVDWDMIARYSMKYAPRFIDRVVMLYNDSNDDERITNESNKYFLNLNMFKRKNCNYPLVTTIIVSYNHENYIRQAIDSVLAQRGDFIHEIIISDDASTDSTHEIIMEYVDKYPGLIVDISNSENKGISENYKKCFRHANGKYVAILEGDDYWVDYRKIDTQVKFLEENDDCSMVFGGIKLLDGGAIKDHPTRKKLASNKLTGYDLFNVGVDVIANYSCCMYRKDILDIIPDCMYRDRLSEIALTFFNEKYGKIGYISKIMSVYRINENGVWSSASPLDKLEQKKMVRKQAMEVCADYYKETFSSIIGEIDSQIEEMQARERELLEKQLVVIRKSNLFNPMWYRKEYQLGEDDDPAEHYYANGLLGVNPSEDFKGDEYLQLNLDVAKSGKNPLIHYEEYGKKEKRITSWNEAIKRYFGEEEVLKKNYINDESYISVVLINDNGEYIIECLNKLLNQNYLNYELIIINIDANCGGQSEIEEFLATCETDILTRVYSIDSNSKYSKADAMQLAAEVSKGSYIAFCEDSDLWDESHLMEINKYISKSDNHARIIVNDVDIFGDIKSVMPVCRRRVEINKQYNSCIKRIKPNEFQSTNYIISLSSVCVRKDVLLSCNFKIVGMPEEIEWWLWRQICFDTPIFYLNKKLTKLRRLNNDNVVIRGEAEEKIAKQDFVTACNSILIKKYPNAKKLLVQNTILDTPQKVGIDNHIENKASQLRTVNDKMVELQKRTDLEIHRRKELEAELGTLEGQLCNLNTIISETRNSATYKISRAITFFPRMVRHLVTNHDL